MDRLRRTLSFRSRKKNNNNNLNNSTDAPTSNNTNNNNNNHSTAASTKTTNNNTPSGTTTADSKPLQWQDDEKAVRLGACNFNVKVRRRSSFDEEENPHRFVLVSRQCRSAGVAWHACLRAGDPSLIKCNYRHRRRGEERRNRLVLAQGKAHESRSSHFW